MIGKEEQIILDLFEVDEKEFEQICVKPNAYWRKYTQHLADLDWEESVAHLYTEILISIAQRECGAPDLLKRIPNRPFRKAQ